MKKIFYLTIFSIVIIVNSKAQDLDNFWEVLPFPSNTNITGVITNRQGDIFVAFNSGVGYYEDGGVFRSTDGGYTWDYVYKSASSSLNRIAINDSGHIYTTTCSPGRLVMSKDNGETWDSVGFPSESRGNIIKIFCHGKDTLLVSTWESNGAYINVSFDNGETWHTSYLTDCNSDYITDIAVSTENEFYVTVSGFVNGRGGVYKSVDGGITWDFFGLVDHQLFAVEINKYDDIFIGIKEGGNGGLCVLYHDTTHFEYLSPYTTQDIAISSDNVICAAAMYSVMLSYDNGKTWKLVTDSLTTSVETLHISADNYLYGAISSRLRKSLNSVVQTNSMHSDLLHNTRIYPNPFVNEINIKLDSPIYFKNNAQIQIVDAMGCVVYNKTEGIAENEINIKTSNLQAGIYFVRIISNSGNIVSNSKIIKTN